MTTLIAGTKEENEMGGKAMQGAHCLHEPDLATPSERADIPCTKDTFGTHQYQEIQGHYI